MLSRLNDLSLRVKLWGVIGLLMAIVVGFSATYYQQSKGTVDFSALERIGNDYLAKLTPISLAAPELAALNDIKALGGIVDSGRVSELKQQLGQAFAELDAMDTSHGELLRVLDQKRALKTTVDQIVAGQSGVTPGQQIIDLSVAVGDNSNLTLDLSSTASISC